MDEAWSNAPSSTINVNFEKSYCVGTSLKQNLSKTRSNHKTWQNKDDWDDGPMGSVGVPIGTSKLKIDGDC